MPRELMPLLETAKGAVTTCPECDAVFTNRRAGDPCPDCTRNAEDGVRTHHAEEAGRDA